MYIVRRLDPPHFEGSKQYWQTVGRRPLREQAEELAHTLKRFSKPGTRYWVGEETEEPKESIETP